MAKVPRHGPILGWREWVALPDLQIDRIKAKIDTGARTSALHAFDIEEYEENGLSRVRFVVHPRQRNDATTIACDAELVESREVKSSTGHASHRPVIRTPIRWVDRMWTIELTLISRDQMGFRMLLGREAIRRRFLVDPAASYIGGRLARKKQA